MIPDGNSLGHIEAIQIRLDKVIKSKFDNLTSTEQYYGTAAHCCPHFVGVNPGQKAAYLTKDVMKSDIANRLSLGMGVCRGFAGLTGVANKPQLRWALREWREFGTERIYLAFDMDFKTNANVYSAREKTVEECISGGFEVVPLTWDSTTKGIDDLLLHFKNQAK